MRPSSAIRWLAMFCAGVLVAPAGVHATTGTTIHDTGTAIASIRGASMLGETAPGAAQLTGTLVGTVRDESGGVVPGASVRLSSAVLLGGPATTLTDDRGQFRFWQLPPGSYTLEIVRQAFAPYREEGIEIGASATIERNAVLRVGSVTDAVVVEGDGSRIEARGSGVEARFGQDYLRSIPTRRFSMFDFVRAAPGISPTSPSSGVNNSVSAFGSGVNENAFLLDGTNFTCPCSGGAVAEPGVDIIQEVQIQSVGASAEYGNIQGAVINVVTRQGGNRFQYDTSYYAQAGALTGQPVLQPCVGCSVPETGYVRTQYRDMTTHVGGPILRDRVWFFGGYQHLRDFDSQPGTDSAFPRKYEMDKVFGKVTWQAAHALRFLHSYHYESWASPERPTLVRPFEVTRRPNGRVPTTTFAHVSHVLSANTMWDARIGRFVREEHGEPSTGIRTIPSRFDRVTGVSSGGVQDFGGLTLIRTTGKATITRYQPRWAGADHEWKAGVQIEQGEHHGYGIIPTGTRYVDSNGQPFQAISSPPGVSGGRFVTAGLFVSDAAMIGTRVTVNAGVRYDYSRALSQDLRGRDGEGRTTADIMPGAGTIYTWNVVSPRLGLTAKLTQGGRTMLRASYGRFHQGVLTGELAPIHPGIPITTVMAFDAATGEYSRLVSMVDPRINIRLDPATRAPRTDELSIAVDRELARRLSVAAAYVRKDGAHFIGWTDTGGTYREEARTLPDGRMLPVFVITNSPNNRLFLLTNPDGYSLTYNGLVLAAEKRQSQGWQAFGSYTLSRTEGLQPSSQAAAAGAQVSSTLGGNPFGRDPNSLTHARGRLPNDRPHALRLMGSIQIPRTGFALAANLQHFSGKPWAATAQIALPQGDQRILLEPRGSQRLPTQTLLDVRVSRMVPCGSAGRVELLLDILNVLNETAAESIATDNLFSPNFSRPTIFPDPRRAMLAVRWNLGG